MSIMPWAAFFIRPVISENTEARGWDPALSAPLSGKNMAMGFFPPMKSFMLF